MQIIEITDPALGNASRPEDIAVGIDFGTTHSLICISNKQQVKFFCNKYNEEYKNGHLVPSVITFQNNGECIVGNKEDLQNAIHSIKRLLGKSKEEIITSSQNYFFDHNLIDSSPSLLLRFKIKDRVLTVPEAAAEIFKYLKSQAEQEIDKTINKAVITVPAYFNDTAKGEILLAAKIAGFEVLRLISEPTAAAYAYGIEKRAEGQFLIYDLGGGTFDVSIINMQSGVLQVIATNGNNMLGGDDVDQILASYLSTKYGLEMKPELIKSARYIKQELSSKEHIKALFIGKLLEISVNEFNALIKPLIDSTINMVRQTLLTINNQKLDGIVLIGGSTRIPLIKSLLLENFDIPILSDINPDEAVAYGAALQAENLVLPMKDDGTLVIDVVPLSLGIELYGGIVEKIILRNSPIPLSITKQFTTYADNQDALIIHVLQGEREMSVDCRSLAKFEIVDLPKVKAGKLKIEVTFSIDANGILSVSAFESTSNKLISVEVKPSFGLSNDDIEKMLNKAFANAAQDHEKKLLQEAINKSELLITKLKGSLAQMPQLVDNQEMQIINENIKELGNVVRTGNRQEILAQLQKLEKSSKDFSETRMQHALANLVTGKNINEVE